MRKIISVVLAISMLFSLCVPAFADNSADIELEVIEGICEHPHTHFVNNGDGTHDEICNDCGKTISTHGQHVDEDEDEICDDCDTPMSEKPECEHEHTRWVDNEDGATHSKYCEDCEETVIETEDHASTDGHYCDKCGAVMADWTPIVLSAEVPVTLPIIVDTLGNVTVPSDAVIKNTTEGKSIAVEGIQVTPSGDWAALPMATDFRTLANNTKSYAIGFRGDVADDEGAIALAADNWNIASEESLKLNMVAKVPMQTEVGEVGIIASVQFSLGWADPEDAATSNDDTGADLQNSVNDQRATLIAQAPEHATLDKTTVVTSKRGQIVELPTVTPNEGYVFSGWQTESGEDIEVGSYVSGSTNIVAVIEAEQGYVVGPHYINTTAMSTALKELTGTITFVHEESPTTAGIDISKEGDGSVIAVVDGEDATIYADQAYMAASSSYMFSGYKAQNIDMRGLNASEVNDIGYLFYDCVNLTKFTLPTFNKDNQLKASSMFSGCTSLPSNPDLSVLQGIVLTDISSMFSGCTFAAVDLSKLSLNEVTTTTSMFSGCTNLKTVDMRKFTMSSCLSTDYMFKGCESLTSVWLPDLSNKSVLSTTYMFNGCSSLETIDLSRFKTAPLKQLSGMFGECSSLKSVDVSGLDVSAARSINSVFSGCSSLTSIDVSMWHTDAAEQITGLFSGCSSLTMLNLANIILHGEYGGINGTFEGCTNLRTLDICSIDDGILTALFHAFDGCTSLQTLKVYSSNALTTYKQRASLDSAFTQTGTAKYDGRTIYILTRS